MAKKSKVERIRWQSKADFDSSKAGLPEWQIRRSNSSVKGIAQYQKDEIKAKQERELFADIKAAVVKNVTGNLPIVDNENSGIPDADEALVRKIKGKGRAILLYLWKRGNVSRDELREAVWKGKSISDKGIDKAVERLNVTFYHIGHSHTKIESSGGIYCLKHPQK